jgi:hypothetical protein
MHHGTTSCDFGISSVKETVAKRVSIELVKIAFNDHSLKPQLLKQALANVLLKEYKLRPFSIFKFDYYFKSLSHFV